MTRPRNIIVSKESKFSVTNCNLTTWVEQTIENHQELYYFDSFSVQFLGNYDLIEDGLIGVL